MPGAPDTPEPGPPEPPPGPKEDRLFWLLLIFPVLAICFPLLLRKACGT